NAAGEVETAIKTGQSVQSVLDVLAAKLRAVVQAIQSVLPNEEVTETARAATADPASVAGSLRRLTRLLSNDDGEAADFIVDAQPDLANVLTGPEMTTLQAFVGNYDFNGALKCVSEIAGRLGIQLE
ncbi:MAG: hypothetical protein WB621_12275, partial [Candidatus Acidiferrales bacterium]